jgi:F0F1-type ATP synthase delta subunit
MDQTFKTLSDQIITNEELGFVLEEIGRIQKNIFSKNSQPLSEQAEESENKTLRNCLQEWEERKLIPENTDERSAFLERLKTHLQTIPQIRIQVARALSNNFLKNISLRLSQEPGEKIILNIILNPKIVGGAIIEYKGEYRNFSLEKKINEIISEKKI